MGQCEGETPRRYSRSSTASTSDFYASTNKCAKYSAAAVATSAARSTAISSTTTSNTVAKLGAIANTTSKAATISSKDMGQRIIKRGWWFREDLLSPRNAVFQSGIPSIGCWKLRRKDATKHGRKGLCSIWTKACDSQYSRACLDGTQCLRSPAFRL